MRVIMCLLLGIYLLSSPVNATIEEWKIVGEPSRVAINFSSSHDYYPRNWLYTFHAYVAVIEAVRQELVRQGKLEDVPIAFQLSDKNFSRSRPMMCENAFISPDIELKTAALRRGESEEILSARRYIIERNFRDLPPPTTPEFLEELLGITLSLKDVTEQKRLLASSDSNKERYASQIAQIKNLIQHFDPIWSPDGKFLVFASWQEAHFEFRVLHMATLSFSPSKTIEEQMGEIRLQQDIPTGRPVWSPDGQFLACADFNSVSVFKSATMQTSVYDMFSWKQYINRFMVMARSHNTDLNNNSPLSNEILLKFRENAQKENLLLVSCDTNFFSDYVTMKLDAKNLAEVEGRENTVAGIGARPQWAKDAWEQARLFDTRRAVSPTGEWTALIEETRGVRRLVLCSRDGRKNFRVADAPGLSLENLVNDVNDQNQEKNSVSSAGSTPSKLKNLWEILLAGAAVLFGALFFAWRAVERPSS